MIEVAEAKTKITIIVNNILGDALGFLPKARIEAYPTAPITAEGPTIAVKIIKKTIRFLTSLSKLSIYYYKT